MAQWLAWAYKPVSKLTESSSTLVSPVSNNTPTQEKSANNNNSTPSIRHLSSEELAKLQTENAKLREAIQQMTKQLGTNNNSSIDNKVQWAKLDGVKGFMINTDNLKQTNTNNNNSQLSNSKLLDEAQINSVKSFYSKLRQELEDTTQKNTPIINNISSPINNNNTTQSHQSDISVQVSAGSAENPIHAIDKEAVVISTIANNTVENNEWDQVEGNEAKANASEEVAVVDLSDIEWWTIVNPVDENGNEIKQSNCIVSSSCNNDDNKGQRSDSEDEGFVLVKDADYVDALADFITKHIQSKYPEAARLPPKQLRKMLDGTFSDLKEPGTVGKAWQWGKFMYTTYGWGQTAWNLYKEPAVIRLVASGVFQAATWILILIL